MKRSLLSFFLIVAAFASRAQVRSATIGVNGLTCSACSRAVDVSLRKLPFVKRVDMNLENTEGKIYFSDSAKVDIGKLAKAVTDAGFSVRSLTLDYVFNGAAVNAGTCMTYNGAVLQFVKTDSKTLNGAAQLKVIGNDFLPKSELSKYKPLPPATCGALGEKVYYVTPL